MPLSSLTQKRLFILGSFVVLLLAVLLYIRINSLVGSFDRINHTNKVELKLEYIASAIKEAETGQRGFLLTQDSSFIADLEGNRFFVDSVMTELKRETKNNAEQQQNFYALQLLIDKRFDLLLKSLSTTDTSRMAMNLDIKRGKRSMDRILEHVDRMKHFEQTNLKQREGERDRYLSLTPLSLLFLVFAILAIIGFSYYGLTKQLKQTQTYATSLDYLNKELVLKNQQLENSVEELNSFNYIASHDLKEPLRKILFFTDMIKGKAHELPTELREHLDKIHTSGERMKALLDDLLTYAQASMAERKTELVDLNTVLDKVVESLAEMINRKNANIIYTNLPIVQAVASQMLQLFENLISNSIKYSREAEPPLITITSNVVAKNALPTSFEAMHDLYHQICVKDNGIGFTQDNAEKIFVLFQRLHQRHEFSGTGIGLTICRKIVQNHQGFITAESEIERGTTFFIYLPA